MKQSGHSSIRYLYVLIWSAGELLVIGLDQYKCCVDALKTDRKLLFC